MEGDAILDKSFIQQAHQSLLSKKVGYFFLPSISFLQSLILAEGFHTFQSSWNRLPIDTAGKRPDRKRRLSKLEFFSESENFKTLQDTLILQSEQFNAVMGGITRQYEPIESSILASPLLEKLLKFQFCLLPLSTKDKQQPWLIEIHQIRIVATPDCVGQPTPYGRHREGCEYAFHTLIDRSNIVPHMLEESAIS